MKIDKPLILEKTRLLFNQRGFASVSYRAIARELGISHSNLIYHFRDKNALVKALHGEILAGALRINREITYERGTLRGLFVSILRGFEVLVDFRFFLVDLNYILRNHPKLHDEFRRIEALRSAMYAEVIGKLVAEGLMRPETYAGEHADLIDQIRVFSDYWVSSSFVYDGGAEGSVRKYVRLLLLLFRPYLTKGGRAEFDALMREYEL